MFLYMYDRNCVQAESSHELGMTRARNHKSKVEVFLSKLAMSETLVNIF